MSQSDRAIKKLATDLARLKREVVSWRGAQADFTSIEAGTMDINDSDGNLVSRVGFQEDGSGATRFFNGPTPPIPSGLSAHVDGPIIQVTWDGSFEDRDGATYDWSHLEVVAVGPSSEQLRGTISDVTGASTSLAATVSGEWTVVARSVSRAEKRSLDGDAGTVEVEIVGLSGAIEDAVGSANGKNTVTYSETPPTPEDEGIDGDTWFVNTFDAETSIMLITEQWQFLSGVWVQTELDHQVIATLDAGKIMVGELDGIRIMARTISGDLFTGDAFDGVVFTGNTFVTRDGNGEFSDNGLFFQKPDGTTIFRVPTDGSAISMSASDVNIDRAQVDDLDVSQGRVRAGGTLGLSAGVTPPPSPPALSVGWARVATFPKPEETADVNGLDQWGDKWVRGVNVYGAEGDRIEVYEEDGTLDDTLPIQLDPRHDVAVIGDIVYVLGRDYSRPDGEVWCFGYDLNTGERVSRWVFPGVAAGKIAMSNADGELLTVYANTGDGVSFRTRNPETGAATQAWDTSWDIRYTKDIQGTAKVGSDIYVAHRNATRVYTVSGSSISRKTGSSNGTNWAGWSNPNKNGAGMVMMVGRLGILAPFVVDGAGAVYEGSQFTSDTPVAACFTWFDGTNETTPSPEVSGFLSARESPAFSMPTRAGLQKRLYFRFGTGDWTRVTLPETLTVLPWTDVLNYTPVSAAPPATNSFPNADPATLKSTNDTFEVKGDGSGKWGPLTFNADGTMSSSQVPEWVPITTFKSGFGAHTFGDAPSYRVWPDGKVEWRGVIGGAMPTTGSKAVLTIPAEARPGRPKNKTAAAQGSGVVRVEFGAAGAQTDLVVYPDMVGGTRAWVSIDELYYYLPQG